ncbi:zinc carboxypeptidase family [Stylonychia lemnae]|uniref:Zinc carboxypeptidase family n=1 Tax=Stylonychia lemnae TaxID=5949 RepID=A0A078B5J8_STYLE|nr:zinc carboxypeptidase family [Stylonychia lemnae]|eukprot:CDW88577.1 zinc carboxypeptidase family [Stylonychia lemnae]
MKDLKCISLILISLGLMGESIALNSYKQYIEFFNANQTFEETDIFDQFIAGSMANYLNYSSTIELSDMLQREFPSILNISTIGQTFLGNEQRLIILTDNSSDSISSDKKKNRNPGTSNTKCPDDLQVGVDLNRNYAYKFSYKDSGSSSNPCAEDYRGPSAFSEPETKNIQNFLQQQDGKIMIALNLHSWGNLLIQPFNYDLDTHNLDLEQNYPTFAKMYHDFNNDSSLPKGMLKGNAMQSIFYDANGEASDWMLQQHKIFALSPELGIEDKRSDVFFIKDIKILHEVMRQNQKWMIELFKKTFSHLKIDLTNGDYLRAQNNDDKVNEVGAIFRIGNRGFRNLQQQTIELEINQSVLNDIQKVQIFERQGSREVEILTVSDYQDQQKISFQINNLGSFEEKFISIKVTTLDCSKENCIHQDLKINGDLFAKFYYQESTIEAEQRILSVYLSQLDEIQISSWKQNWFVQNKLLCDSLVQNKVHDIQTFRKIQRRSCQFYP